MVGCTDGVIEGLAILLVSGTDKSKSDSAAALGNLAVNTELRSSILEFPRVLDGLRSMLMSGSEQHAGEAACCLQNLAVTTIDHKLRIAATENLLLGLVNLMMTSQPASQFQEDACSALLNLVVGCTENKKAVGAVTGVLQALQQCLQVGSDRAKEHGAAVLQNLTFNSNTNRMAVLAVPSLLTALNHLVADVASPSKAAEYSAACLSSLSRTREGAIAVACNEGTLDGLVLRASSLPGNSMVSRKASMSALQTLTQTPEAAVLLLRKNVHDRCFLPVLHDVHRIQHDEAGRRVLLCAAIGMAYLCNLETRLLDRIPDEGIDIIISTLASNVRVPRGDCIKSSKYRSADLLVPLNILASSDHNKFRLLQAGVVTMLGDILQTSNLGQDVLTGIECVKLFWHLSFLPEGRAEILDCKILDTLHDDLDGWVSGLRWQLDISMNQTLPVHEHDSNETRSDNDGFVLIIADRADSQAHGIITQNLIQGGLKVWPKSLTAWPVKMSGFSTAAHNTKAALILVSPSCELSPCCRSQAAHVKRSGVPYLCLNLGFDSSPFESTYVQHGYLLTEHGSSISCIPAMLEDGDMSALNGIIVDLITSSATTTSQVSHNLDAILPSAGPLQVMIWQLVHVIWFWEEIYKRQFAI